MINAHKAPVRKAEGTRRLEWSQTGKNAEESQRESLEPAISRDTKGSLDA